MPHLHPPICDLPGIRTPIVLAGMGGLHGRLTPPELVAAVSNAGGLGVTGLTDVEPVDVLVRRWMPTGFIAHVQVNDRNRRGPGQGTMKFGPILRALQETGYAGVVAAEPFDYVPDGMGSAAWASGYLRGLLEAPD